MLVHSGLRYERQATLSSLVFSFSPENDIGIAKKNQKDVEKTDLNEVNYYYKLLNGDINENNRAEIILKAITNTGVD